MRIILLTLCFIILATTLCAAQVINNADRPKALNKSTNYLPKWSPDGSRIAFCSTKDGNWEIYTMRADGSMITRLTNHSAYDFAPSWSPDGSKIVYCSGWNNQYEIYVMNSDGSHAVRITRIVYP